MYMLYIGIIIVFAFGYGIFAPLATFGPSNMGDLHGRAAAVALYNQHSNAVRWVEQQETQGNHPTGAISPAIYSTTGAVRYDMSAFGAFHTARVAAADTADWATITWITPDDQADMRENSAYPMEPESMLRQVIELSGNSLYAIGVYNNGLIQPLDRSALLMAPTNTSLSPMGEQAGAPAWSYSTQLPRLDNPPSGLVNGSWVLMTMTPSY